MEVDHAPVQAGALRARRCGCLGGSSGGALASPAQSPTPTSGTPSRNGLIIAEINQASGPGGPSGNSEASAGPGVFLGQDTHQAILDVARGPNC
jgi:hypothetical protein